MIDTNKVPLPPEREGLGEGLSANDSTGRPLRHFVALPLPLWREGLCYNVTTFERCGSSTAP